MPIDAPIHVNEANLPRVLGAGVPVVLVFWRRECPHCDQLAPALDRLARRFAGRALIARVNVIDEPRLAQRSVLVRGLAEPSWRSPPRPPVCHSRADS